MGFSLHNMSEYNKQHLNMYVPAFQMYSQQEL